MPVVPARRVGQPERTGPDRGLNGAPVTLPPSPAPRGSDSAPAQRDGPGGLPRP